MSFGPKLPLAFFDDSNFFHSFIAIALVTLNLVGRKSFLTMLAFTTGMLDRRLTFGYSQPPAPAINRTYLFVILSLGVR